MSLFGMNERFPVRILRDTGAHDSFVLERCLHFLKSLQPVVTCWSCQELAFFGTGFVFM